MADIRGLLSSELGQVKVLALALQMAGAAKEIPQFALDQVCVQLLSQSHYDTNGNHVLFRSSTNSRDMNIAYHSALVLVDSHQTEGAILNALSSTSTGAKVNRQYVTDYLRQLHTVSPYDIDTFYRNIHDLTLTENRQRLIAAFNADSKSALVSLYYDLDCKLMAAPLVQTVRWIRMMLLPYLAISSDLAKIGEFITNRSNSFPTGLKGVAYAPILQFAVERNLLLMPTFRRFVSPKVFLESETKSIEICNELYDVAETSDDIPLEIKFYNMFKIQIAILIRDLIPSLHIRTEWEDIIPAEIYPQDSRYILRFNEIGLKYRATVEFNGKTVEFSSNNPKLMEGFIRTAMVFDVPSRTLRDLKDGVEAYFDTTLPEHKAYVSSLTTTQ